MKARDIMTREVITVTPDHSVRHAAHIMSDKGISGVPVTNGEGKVVGMLTDGDLLRRVELGTQPSACPDSTECAVKDIAGFVKAHSWQVGDVMSREVITANEDAPLAQLASLLRQHNIKRVPVMRDGRMVGIVSRSDLLRCIANAPVEEPLHGTNVLKRSVQARLRERADLLSTIPEVTVSEGIVYLSGKVKSQLERDVVRVIVESVRGVAGVEDRLEIVAQPTLCLSPSFLAN